MYVCMYMCRYIHVSVILIVYFKLLGTEADPVPSLWTPIHIKEYFRKKYFVNYYISMNCDNIQTNQFFFYKSLSRGINYKYFLYIFPFETFLKTTLPYGVTIKINVFTIKNYVTINILLLLSLNMRFRLCFSCNSWNGRVWIRDLLGFENKNHLVSIVFTSQI